MPARRVPDSLRAAGAGEELARIPWASRVWFLGYWESLIPVRVAVTLHEGRPAGRLMANSIAFLLTSVVSFLWLSCHLQED